MDVASVKIADDEARRKPRISSMGRSAALEQAYVHDVYEICNEVVSPLRPRVTQFLTSLEPGSVVCDVGCGNGRYLTPTNSFIYSIGIDRCHRLSQAARSRGNEKLASGKKNSWFLDSINAKDNKLTTGWDVEDAKNLPIELRRLEDFDDVAEPFRLDPLAGVLPSPATADPPPPPPPPPPRVSTRILTKQASLNEDLMAESRQRDREGVRKRIQKQASLNESFLCRSLSKRLQLLGHGLGGALKSSTEGLERATKTSLGRIIKTMASNGRQELIRSGVQPGLVHTPSDDADGHPVAMVQLPNDTTEIPPMRHTHESESDSSKESSLQSDTSVESEDSFASVIYVPNAEQKVNPSPPPTQSPAPKFDAFPEECVSPVAKVPPSRPPPSPAPSSRKPPPMPYICEERRLSAQSDDETQCLINRVLVRGKMDARARMKAYFSARTTSLDIYHPETDDLESDSTEPSSPDSVDSVVSALKLDEAVCGLTSMRLAADSAPPEPVGTAVEKVPVDEGEKEDTKPEEKTEEEVDEMICRQFLVDYADRLSTKLLEDVNGKWWWCEAEDKPKGNFSFDFRTEADAKARTETDAASVGGSATHHRYYHVFREGELEALINHNVTSLHIVSSYYEPDDEARRKPRISSMGRSAALEQAYVHDVYEICNEVVSPLRPRVTQFLTSLEPGSVVCDVGCGNGRYLTPTNSFIYSIGIDRCHRLSQAARSRGNEIALCDNLELPFRNVSFDAVLSLAVVHHFATKDRRVEAIKEIARILRIGGRAIITVWALEQRNRRFESQDILIPWQLSNSINAKDNKLTTGWDVEDAKNLPIELRRLEDFDDVAERFRLDPLAGVLPSPATADPPPPPPPPPPRVSTRILTKQASLNEDLMAESRQRDREGVRKRIQKQASLNESFLCRSLSKRLQLLGHGLGGALKSSTEGLERATKTSLGRIIKTMASNGRQELIRSGVQPGLVHTPSDDADGHQVAMVQLPNDTTEIPPMRHTHESESDSSKESSLQSDTSVESEDSFASVIYVPNAEQKVNPSPPPTQSPAPKFDAFPEECVSPVAKVPPSRPPPSPAPSSRKPPPMPYICEERRLSAQSDDETQCLINRVLVRGKMDARARMKAYFSARTTSLDIYHPETDDLESDSTEPSSPDSVDSVVSALKLDEAVCGLTSMRLAADPAPPEPVGTAVEKVPVDEGEKEDTKPEEKTDEEVDEMICRQFLVDYADRLSTKLLEDVNGKLTAHSGGGAKPKTSQKGNFSFDFRTEADAKARTETDAASVGGSATHHRYYHVFREGELEALINHNVTSLHIVSSYYERASWCVVAEKVQI
uniref:Methyltransferase type 11 domain-containing protein n=2 Tax=Lutzomyia longipalpis TaxID=7200 RepID=A0A1B0CGQ2_LUTLO